MHSRQEVQIRAGVLERIDHVVRHIRAGARLAIDPSSPQKEKVSALRARAAHADDYVRT
jgi:hypothetical protein